MDKKAVPIKVKSKGVKMNSLESVSPYNLCNAQWCYHKVNGAKDGVIFPQHLCRNCTIYFRLKLLQ
jgi:hypothetical protein